MKNWKLWLIKLLAFGAKKLAEHEVAKAGKSSENVL